jgi:hypothetical protein
MVVSAVHAKDRDDAARAGPAPALGGYFIGAVDGLRLHASKGRYPDQGSDEFS